jgi:hypothetical protein
VLYRLRALKGAGIVSYLQSLYLQNCDLAY